MCETGLSLVDKREDGQLAHARDLEQLARLRLDALGLWREEAVRGGWGVRR